jgi:hypothetical protein
MRQIGGLLLVKSPLGRLNTVSDQGNVIRTEAQRWLDILPLLKEICYNG